jgi:hypothetical protein
MTRGGATDVEEQRKPGGPLRRLKRALRVIRQRRIQDIAPPGPRLRLGLDPVEVHSVVCASDVPMSLWSLSSFVAFTGLRPRVVLHDDGTLTQAHRDAYARAFEGIEVLDAQAMDRATDQALQDHPVCAAFRRRPDFYCARKLFDLLVAAHAPTLLVLDSDVLFFRRPERLLECMAQGAPCFGSDYQSSYAAPPEALAAWRGAEVLPQVNAGLLHVPVEGYRSHLDLIERYLAFAQATLPPGQVNQHEQTAHALLMTELGAERLPAGYQLQGELGPHTVSHHFVRDGKQRARFWHRGVRRIRRDVARRLARLARG